MVTWGNNTVHSFGGSAPAAAGQPAAAPAPAFSFGGASPSPAPAATGGSAFSFGSTTTTTTTPAPAPGGTTSLFGSTTTTPAPSTTGGLFGSSPAAPSSTSSSLFGAPAPASGSTSLFGAPSPGTSSSAFGFGQPAAGGAFGQPSQQQQAQPQMVPAQAALQAHMNASAQQEAARVQSKLQSIHSAYTGTLAPPVGAGTNSNDTTTTKFVTIVYSDISPEQRQLQWVHGMATGGTIFAPPKPPQVSEHQWNKAVAENPDPQNLMPVACVGAVALQSRVSWQQTRANEYAATAKTLQTHHDMLKERLEKVQQRVEQLNQSHATLRKRLLEVMKRVELARCMNQPIQPAEVESLQTLKALYQQVEVARTSLLRLQDKTRSQPTMTMTSPQITAVPDKGKLLPVFQEHRSAIETVTNAAKKDIRDVQLIQKRLLQTNNSHHNNKVSMFT